MRFTSLFGPTPIELVSIIHLWPVLTSLLPSTWAINFDPVASPNLDLSKLGRVALAGDFDAISLYTYEQQNQNGYSTNGSQSILTRFPNGAFATLASADASIKSMCPFVMKNGKLAGVVVGGNFTSLGGKETQGVALVDPSNGNVTALPGLNGSVNALLCDAQTETVYVGGEFSGGNSTNAIAWVGNDGWTNLNFAGFNGPVTSIVKAADGNIVFGGAFDGLGNTTTPNKKDMQVVNIASASISATSSTSKDGFSDPHNIVCKTDGKDGPGKTWLLADKSPGSWEADFGFGFRPTKLRIWNTHQDGRGTKTFRFTALPIRGIMNLTYVDPATGKNASCDARCPLSDNTTLPYQDFKFVNVIGMSSVYINISEWYGDGGGLNGIELFQDDIYAFAINDFNEPSCANVELGSNSTVTGPWSVRPSAQSSSNYLSANINGRDLASNPAAIVFQPDVKQSGNYSVTLFTPGCNQDNSCSSRGIVNVTGTFASGTRANPPSQAQIYQTNNFDKYDQIYSGYVNANSDSFRPTVTITPSLGQSGDLNFVAQRVRFELTKSTGGLNGLFEFNSSQATINTDFSISAVDTAGTELGAGAVVSQLAVQGDTTYVAGNFSTDDFANIFAISDGNSTSLTAGGVNSQITTMFLNGSLLYVGGNFTDTVKAKTSGLSHLAAYSIPDKVWQPLGAGVNGRVNAIVPLILNTTDGKPELVITINGNFDQVLAFGNNEATDATGLAVWVPSRKNWLQNLDAQSIALSGTLTAATDIPGSDPIFAGTISSQGLGANDAVSLPITGDLRINPLPLSIQPKQLENSSKRKRAGISGQNVTGVVTGLFYESGDRNITILGGHFTARATNGSALNNLVFINGSSSDRVTGVGERGLDDDSVFLALAVQGDTLYAGGTVTGSVQGANINGLILYDLKRANYVPTQPPAFMGRNVAVNSIATRPNTADVYVGGDFESAGSLSCPSVCNFRTSTSQWNRVGTGLVGSVASLTWSGASTLIAGGNLTLSGNDTSMATYDTKTDTWSALTGAEAIPGPVTALAPANDAASQFWVAGKSTNGSAFLMKYDGKGWKSVGDSLGKATTIRGLQVLSLKQNHAQSPLIERDMTLVLTGQLDLPNFGNASAALFNGTTFSPFILSTTSGNLPGSLSQIFSAQQNFFNSGRKNLAVGFVVLISLAIALTLIFILVVIGIVAERWRRKREGYMPAPTQMYDKASNMERVPPEHLFGAMSQQTRGPSGAPML
ncbi:MAG: hypothetical protein M1812_002977 [Candelaria pacifica]|nr:MAG: hypothetical protein M1812_002977 [Candelaria pacifica]